MKTGSPPKRGRGRAGAALLVALLCLCVWPAQGGCLPTPGQKAPAFALPELADVRRVATSSSVFRDRTTVLSFFATWCEPCKKEIGELRVLEQRYRSKGFQVVLVCLDIMGARNVPAYLNEAGAGALRVLCDKQGTASNLYGVVQLPANVVVGPDETVLQAWDTYRPEKLRELEALLSQLPARPGSPEGR